MKYYKLNVDHGFFFKKIRQLEMYEMLQTISIILYFYTTK